MYLPTMCIEEPISEVAEDHGVNGAKEVLEGDG
jgi:hypothetical protein